jgi:hypothetical protein
MRPTSDSDSDVRDAPRGTFHPEANDPSPSPWAEVPGQREPDHDGQLYVGAAHPDTDVAPDEAARHEPVPVDESGEPVDRADDETAHDETADEPDAYDEPDAHDEPDEPDEPDAHDQHDEPDAHDQHDEPDAFDQPDESDVPAHDEPAPVVAVPFDRDETAEPAAEPTPDGAASELKPGDVPVAPVTAFLDETVAQDLRQRWREAQFGFVDDPQKAAEDVRNLVNEAIDTVTAALSSQRDTLGGAAGGDTEHYRVTVQRCRALFDRLLNL